MTADVLRISVTLRSCGSSKKQLSQVEGLPVVIIPRKPTAKCKTEPYRREKRKAHVTIAIPMFSPEIDHSCGHHCHGFNEG